MTALSPTDRVRRRDGFLSAEIDGEVVALNAEKGICYGLDTIGSVIWAMIEKPVSIGDLCARLTARYRVDPATCARDVIDWLEDLRREGMIASAPDAASPPSRA